MTSRMSMDALLDALAGQGLADEADARQALAATVAVLGERLTADEARAFADVLPAEIAPVVSGGDAYDGDFDADELFEPVRRRERTSSGRAREHAEIVVTVLGEHLDPDRRTRIARGLPGVAGELLRGGRRELGEPPPHRDDAQPSRAATTLASSHPGSSHPVSEAAPPPGQTHSIARNPAPHADTKLSQAEGLTQERLDDTVARGRPGSRRAVSGARPK